MSSRKSSRGGRGGRGGRGRGRRGGRGRGDGGHHRNHHHHHHHHGNNNYRDEDVLIEFMPFIRAEDAEAKEIHSRLFHDQKAFLKAARDFLQKKRGERQPHKQQPKYSSSNGSSSKPKAKEEQQDEAKMARGLDRLKIQDPTMAKEGVSKPTKQEKESSTPKAKEVISPKDVDPPKPIEADPPQETAPTRLLEFTPSKEVLPPKSIEISPSKKIFPPQPIEVVPPGEALPPKPVEAAPPKPVAPPGLNVEPVVKVEQEQITIQASMKQPQQLPSPMKRMPPPPPGILASVQVEPQPVVGLSSPTGLPQPPIGLPEWLQPKTSNNVSPSPIPIVEQPPKIPIVQALGLSGAITPVKPLPPQVAEVNQPALPMPLAPVAPSTPTPASGILPAQIARPSAGSWVPCAPGNTGNTRKEEDTPDPNRQPAVPTTPEPNKPRKEYQPKRLWTRYDQQPGRIFANNVPPNSHNNGASLILRPREELTAKWILPIKYLQQRVMEKRGSKEHNATIQDALASLAVGLFRRGCAENGTNASIISKQVLAPPDEDRLDYPFEVDPQNGVVWGTVPFYAPRTPGHVLFRLYWQDEPLYTLATGPTLFVCVTEGDFEPTLRFILSNFKSKKGSATSLSSLNSLAIVLDQFRPPDTRGRQQHYGQQNNQWDSAGRAAWGCICESRKVLEACAAEYTKAGEKLKRVEEEVETLMEQKQKEEETEVEETKDDVVEDENKTEDGNEQGNDHGEENEKSVTEQLWEKKHTLMGGRAANERRWKDSQVAFASILKAVVNNPSSILLFRRELLAKLRLEFELWCPLCESFAHSPFNSDEAALSTNFNEFPPHVNPGHYRQCIESRSKMQQELLGFVPNRLSLAEILISKDQRGMDRVAVDVFNKISGSMGHLYQKVYMVEDRIHQQREMVRAHIEGIVAKCDAFPPGTRVIVFGSSANGFGSPTSDLDMCLQLPLHSSVTNEDDKTGALAMAKLAELLEMEGLQNVNTMRLTARIPIVMFNCKRPMAAEGESPTMECDLSMQNPLACLNTSLLLTYSRIHPVTRVLASIIKRWAKARDINNPSKHTLSSYGYIIMLLHFLTYHRRTGTGLVTRMTNERNADANPLTISPLLPNLQWMDPQWLKSPMGAPYNELKALPANIMQHPLESAALVNTYFHRVVDPSSLGEIQQRFPSQDLSLAILLASFFHYYAFEFYYKRHIVSLHSTGSHGLVEREVKAEQHGWKVYSTSLAIEDPFETFYDVAHVLKGSNYHRLRNELALAYTKIANAASGRGGPKSGMELIDWICEPIEHTEE